MSKRKIKSLIIITISLIILGISFNQFYLYLKDNQQTKSLITNIKRTPQKEINNTSNYPQSLYNPPKNLSDIYYKYVTVPFLEVDFTDLLKQNKDTICWIKVEGTSINNVVVQTTNNDYYLTHSFNHEINKAGWIFSDYRNNFDNLNDNTIIYGHRRLDGTMFGPLIDILTEEYLNNINNHIIKISTPNNNYIFETISVYTIDKESYYITSNFSQPENYLEFLNTLKNRSIHDFNTTLDANDKILTLSTCYNNFGKRIVLHAKLIKKETR